MGLADHQCKYQICNYSFDSYSNRVFILIPSLVTSATPVRIHLHGFSQNPDGTPYNNNFDIGLKNNVPVESFEKTISAYGMARSVCGDSPEILVVPVSYYRCDDYKKSFLSQDDLNAFIKELEGKINHPILEKKLIISAHSGGGNRLSDILTEDDPRISKVMIFDGLYDGSTNIYNWITMTSSVEVNLINLYKEDGVPGEPYTTSMEVLQKLKNLSLPIESSSLQVNHHLFTVDRVVTADGVEVKNFYQDKAPTLDHWGLVSAMWNQ